MQQITHSPVIHRLRETDSTNNEATRHYATAVDGEVWTAEFQCAGKGQQSNSWESEAGKNLLFSIFLRPQRLKAAEQFRLSQAVSLAVCEALREEGVNAVIKWPNDIYVGKKKIVGMLIEQHVMGEYVTSAVAGIGLNVNQVVFRSPAPNPTSLALETGKTFDLELLLQQLLKHIAGRYAGLAAAGLKEDYLRCLFRYDKWAHYEADNIRFKGKIVDVLPTGELVLLLKNAKKVIFSFKNIVFCLVD